MIELIIFDIDGTLAEKYSLNLLPGVKDFFELVCGAACQQRPKIALATNQGGVGMRYWMEKGRFGDPEKLPTEADIEERLRSLVASLCNQASLPVYISYRYRTKKGRSAPVPPEQEDNPRWSVDWRKPEPGMLLQAMADAGAPADRTLFVGDSQDDLAAAQSAGTAFEWAEVFFARLWTGCEGIATFLNEGISGD